MRRHHKTWEMSFLLLVKHNSQGFSGFLFSTPVHFIPWEPWVLGTNLIGISCVLIDTKSVTSCMLFLSHHSLHLCSSDGTLLYLWFLSGMLSVTMLVVVYFRIGMTWFTNHPLLSNNTSGIIPALVNHHLPMSLLIYHLSWSTSDP